MSKQRRTEELTAMMAASYGKPVGDQEMNLIKLACKRWGFDAAMDGFEAHLFDPTDGRFPPTIASIAKQIEGPTLTPIAIVAAARAADTPLGCLARIKHLPKPDLDSRDSFYLHAQAEQFLQQLPAIRKRIDSTGYKQHELHVLGKYGVDASAPFALGLGRPANALQLQQQADKAASGSERLECLKPAYAAPTGRLPNPKKLVGEIFKEANRRISADECHEQTAKPAVTKDEIAKAIADCEARKQVRQDSILGQIGDGGDDNE